MKADFWIKIKVRECKYGQQPRPFEINGPPSCTMSKPSTGINEFAFKVSFTIPDSYFRTPELAINIEMPDLSDDHSIDSTIQENLSDIIRQQLGVKAHISIAGEAALAEGEGNE